MSGKNRTSPPPQAQLSARAHEALATIIERLTLEAGVYFVGEFVALCESHDLNLSAYERMALRVSFVDAMTRPRPTVKPNAGQS